MLIGMKSSLAVLGYLVMCAAESRTYRNNLNNPIALAEDFAKGLTRRQLREQTITENVNVEKALRIYSKASISSNNSSDCQRSLVTLFDDFAQKKSYAIRVVDSWGRPGSGIELGNIQWMGRYYECVDVLAPTFSGKYFFLYLGYKSAGAENRKAGIGVCLPVSCSTWDAEILASNIYNTTVQAYTPSRLIISTLVGLVLFATGYELYCEKNKQPEGEYRQIEEVRSHRSSVMSSAFLSFSAIKNTRAILETKQRNGTIELLHGLRFISMAWIILGHTFTHSTNSFDNGIDAARVFITNWTFQTVGNALFSVDTFFYISGLLGAYVGLKEIERRNGKFNVLLMYAYRYLRLTPAYALCILITATIYIKFGDGPMWSHTAVDFETGCRSYWWASLLYINNMYPWTLNEGCAGWGWYLANDMQFFLLLPLLLYVMHRRQLLGTIITGVIVLLSVIASGVITWYYGKQPYAVGMGMSFHQAVNEATSLRGYVRLPVFANGAVGRRFGNATSPHLPLGKVSNSFLFWSDTYSKPWCRMGPYFVGVIAGQLLRSNPNRIRMYKILALLGWIASIAIGMVLVYGLFGHIQTGKPMPIALCVFYEGVSRPVWALCLTWLVLACSWGYGGPINAILSWKAFVPLSRLTYCAYLVHPLVLIWMYGIMETKLHFSIPMMSFLYSGVLLVSYSIAYVFSLLIEMPMMGITKLLFKRTEQANSTVTQTRNVFANEDEISCLDSK